MKRSEAEKLAALIREELRQPQDVQRLYERVDSSLQESHPLAEFLSAKDRQHRQVYYLQSEERWFRLFGWTMAKALMLFGLLVAGAFVAFQGRLTSEQATMLLFGASAYYIVVYLLSIRRHSKNARQIQQIHSRYQEELHGILEELEQQHSLQPARDRLSEK